MNYEKGLNTVLNKQLKGVTNLNGLSVFDPLYYGDKSAEHCIYMPDVNIKEWNIELFAKEITELVTEEDIKEFCLTIPDNFEPFTSTTQTFAIYLAKNEAIISKMKYTNIKPDKEYEICMDFAQIYIGEKFDKTKFIGRKEFSSVGKHFDKTYHSAIATGTDGYWGKVLEYLDEEKNVVGIYIGGSFGCDMYYFDDIFKEIVSRFDIKEKPFKFYKYYKNFETEEFDNPYYNVSDENGDETIDFYVPLYFDCWDCFGITKHNEDATMNVYTVFHKDGNVHIDVNVYDNNERLGDPTEHYYEFYLTEEEKTYFVPYFKQKVSEITKHPFEEYVKERGWDTVF